MPKKKKPAMPAMPPAGMHKMPDGTMMNNAEMMKPPVKKKPAKKKARKP